MSAEPKPVDIDNAIRYALRAEPLEEYGCDEDGDFRNVVTEIESVKPFVMAVLRDLGVIK